MFCFCAQCCRISLSWHLHTVWCWRRKSCMWSDFSRWRKWNILLKLTSRASRPHLKCAFSESLHTHTYSNYRSPPHLFSYFATLNPIVFVSPSSSFLKAHEWSQWRFPIMQEHLKNLQAFLDASLYFIAIYLFNLSNLLVWSLLRNSSLKVRYFVRSFSRNQKKINM